MRSPDGFMGYPCLLGRFPHCFMGSPCRFGVFLCFFQVSWVFGVLSHAFLRSCKVFLGLLMAFWSILFWGGGSPQGRLGSSHGFMGYSCAFLGVFHSFMGFPFLFLGSCHVLLWGHVIYFGSYPSFLGAPCDFWVLLMGLYGLLTSFWFLLTSFNSPFSTPSLNPPPPSMSTSESP